MGNPVAEEVVEGGGDHDEEDGEEVVDLRTCRPKANGRSYVWTQRLFLLDPRKRAVCTCCALPIPHPKGNTSNLIAHYESPNVDEDHNVKLDEAKLKMNQTVKALHSTQTTLDASIT